jgi:protein O-mannosyl-transferase
LTNGVEPRAGELNAARELEGAPSLPWTRADTWLAGLQVFLIALVYARTLRFDFVLDDFPLILQNPLVLEPWKSIPRFFTEGYFQRIFPQAPANDYRPLLSVWLLVNQRLWGFNPAGWHVAPIFLQALVTLGVYLVARRLLEERAAAALASLVFALHPVHVETTAWVIGMNESLMAVPFLLGFLAYLRSRDGPARSRIWLAASLFGYALALCAKEDAVVLPALIAAWAWFYGAKAEGTFRQGLARRAYAAVAVSLPYLALTAVYLAIRFMVLRGLTHTATAIPFATLVWTAPLALWSDIRVLLWPSGLSIFYDLPYVTSPLSINFLLPAAALAAILACLGLWTRRSRDVSFATVWLFAPVLPLLDLRILPEGEFVHDRYLYLSSIAFALLIAIAAKQFRRPAGERPVRQPAEPWNVGRMAFAGAMVLALTYGALSFYYAGFWVNNLTLFVRGVNLSPGNNTAVNNLANEFVKQGRYGAASELYQKVIQRAPEFWLAQYNLGVCDYKMGYYEDALSSLSRAAALEPSEADIFVYAGLSLFRLNRLPEAASSLRGAIALRPDGPGYHLALGIVLKTRGERDQALAEFKQELHYHPEESAARAEIAKLESKAR